VQAWLDVLFAPSTAQGGAVIARLERRLPARLRQVAGWAAGVAGVWAVAGPVIGVAWCAVAAWHLLRPPPPRLLIGVSAWLLGLVPVLWVAGNASRLGQVSTQLVLENPAPGPVAAAALALLVTGVCRDVRGRPESAGRRRPGDPGPTPDPSPPGGDP
jgi:MFS family permease